MKSTSPDADDVERALDPYFHLWDVPSDTQVSRMGGASFGVSVPSLVTAFCGRRVNRSRLAIFSVVPVPVTCPGCLDRHLGK